MRKRAIIKPLRFLLKKQIKTSKAVNLYTLTQTKALFTALKIDITSSLGELSEFVKAYNNSVEDLYRKLLEVSSAETIGGLTVAFGLQKILKQIK